ncbi:MAG: monovalent cation/H(+) antiporter subunit G [Phycisphaerales bacterium]|nr:monovalent cation/H(+) antiporter subunit G [Phycisphaerales bacterium]
MSTLSSVITVLGVLAGVCFFVAGTVGLLRFPDPLSRLHALTKADNLGLGLIVLGLMPQAEWPLGPVRLLVVWLAAILSSAVASQLVGGAIRRSSGSAGE